MEQFIRQRIYESKFLEEESWFCMTLPICLKLCPGLGQGHQLWCKTCRKLFSHISVWICKLTITNLRLRWNNFLYKSFRWNLRAFDASTTYMGLGEKGRLVQHRVSHCTLLTGWTSLRTRFVIWSPGTTDYVSKMNDPGNKDHKVFYLGSGDLNGKPWGNNKDNNKHVVKSL